MSAPPVPKQYVALNYMTRFSCLGGDCEDTCCHWWQVKLDRDDYTRLKNAMSHEKDEAAAFKTGVKRLRGESAQTAFATLEFDGNGYCRFLDGGRLCTVHQGHGEKALPTICATYPRIVTLVGDRVEYSGVLSCPEVARQALLADDAMELVDFDAESLPRKRFIASIDAEATEPYLRYFDDVRAAVLKLLTVPFPLASRFFFVSFFVSRLGEFFTATGEGFSEERLAGELQGIDDEAVLGQLHEQFERLDLTDELLAAITQEIFAARVQVGVHPAFAELIRSTYASYLDEADAKRLEAGEEVTVSFASVWERYRERAAFWRERCGERLDQYFTNYAFNYWVRSWYVTSPTLLDHMLPLILSVAAMRFLLFGDADLENTRADGASDDLLIEALDQRMVRVAYLFSRNVEHNAGFLPGLQESLREKGVSTFAHLVALLKG